MAYPGNPAPRLTDGAGSTLPLLAYLAIATVLMVADLRGGFAAKARVQLTTLVEPVWWLASAPGRLSDGASEFFSSRAALQQENERLHRELQVNASRLHRLLAVAEENQRLRGLLGGTRGYRLEAQLASIIDVDLDPSRQRIVLDAGGNDGVRVGQAMIDAGGVLGQVIEVTPRHSTALLLTDPEHAVPVQVARTGLRAIAYGTGRTDMLRLPSIPQSGDIRVGDRLVTSGIGGRFPAGFPVGVILSVQPDETQAFVVAEARPSARLDRGVEVLLVSNTTTGVDAGPPLPPPPVPVQDPAPAGADAPAVDPGQADAPQPQEPVE
ncbi:rod shape-determining protein MreC [Arenimonas aestuarii]